MNKWTNERSRVHLPQNHHDATARSHGNRVGTLDGQFQAQGTYGEAEGPPDDEDGHDGEVLVWEMTQLWMARNDVKSIKISFNELI